MLIDVRLGPNLDFTAGASGRHHARVVGQVEFDIAVRVPDEKFIKYSFGYGVKVMSVSNPEVLNVFQFSGVGFAEPHLNFTDSHVHE